MTERFFDTEQSALIPADGSPPSADLVWEAFFARFPTEKECVEELRRIIGDANSSCRFCKAVNVPEKNGERFLHCRSCGKKNWLTGGTFFHNARSLRHYFAYLWLLDHGVPINAFQFHKRLGIAYSTAHKVFKKVGIVLAGTMDNETAIVPSSSFLSLMGRRSRETPAGRHPSAEEEEVQKTMAAADRQDFLGQRNEASDMQADLSDTNPAGNALKAGQEEGTAEAAEGTAEGTAEAAEGTAEEDLLVRRIKDMIGGERIHFDTLFEKSGVSLGELSAALLQMELDRSIDRLPGEWFRRAPAAVHAAMMKSTVANDPHTLLRIEVVTDFVCQTFQRVSRKYLQHYLAVHWWLIGGVSGWGRVIKECLRFGKITKADILAYVTPPMVKIHAT